MTNAFQNIFISSALAQDAQAQVNPTTGIGLADFTNYLPLVMIFLVFYILMIRPQQKKLDEQTRMLKALQPGDQVITQSGIHATVVKIEDESHVVLEIADGVRIKLVKTFITHRTAAGK